MPLTSLRLLVALGLMAVAVLVLTVRGYRRSRRALVGAAGGVAVLLVLVAGAAAGVNRHFDLYRSWSELVRPRSADLEPAQGDRQLAVATSVRSAAVGPGRGTVLSLRIPPATSHLHVGGAYVYLPPQYRQAGHALDQFPVVQAFSGSPGKPADWLNGINADAQLDHAIDTGQLAPAIVVFAPTNTSVLRSLECTDTADGLRDETYLTADVRAWVTSHLRTDGHRWAAIGYSTGGYCALDLAFRHPGLYDRAISLDGYGRALADGYARGLWHSAADRLEHSPDWWVQHHEPEGVSVYLEAGTSDHGAVRDTLRTWKALTAAGWLTPHDQLLAQRGGRHTFDAWAHAFIPSLVWALPGPGGSRRELPAQVALLIRASQHRS